MLSDADLATTSPAPGARPRFATAVFARTTWDEAAFHAAHLPIAIGAFTWWVLTLSAGIPLAVTWAGLVVTAFLFAGSNWFAVPTRALSARLLGQVVRPPAGPERRRGFLGWCTARLAHGPTWRAMAYGLVGFVLTLTAFCISLAVLVAGIGALTHAVWSRFLPEQLGTDGRMHSGAQLGTVFVDTVPLQLAFAAVGAVVVLFVWPSVNHGLASLQRVVIRTMLGASRAERRLIEVTRSRSSVVEDADATLRRIERDLHDGAQARLVALAMTLGDARDRLQTGADPVSVAALVDRAHASTKEALIELRDLARGIHPPVLDEGLESALSSACARAPFPVDLRVALTRRPSTVVETTAYFGVLELLTNASKHARATRAVVTVTDEDEMLVVAVQDDGIGGAHVAFGDERGCRTGLAGLLERVRSVDGALQVASPTGGPTRVTMRVPMATTPTIRSGAGGPAGLDGGAGVTS